MELASKALMQSTERAVIVSSLGGTSQGRVSTANSENCCLSHASILRAPYCPPEIYSSRRSTTLDSPSVPKPLARNDGSVRLSSVSPLTSPFSLCMVTPRPTAGQFAEGGLTAAGLGPPLSDAEKGYSSHKSSFLQGVRDTKAVAGSDRGSIHGSVRRVLRRRQCVQVLAQLRSSGASEQPYGIPERRVPDRWDVVGLGQAMDLSCELSAVFPKSKILVSLCGGKEKTAAWHTFEVDFSGIVPDDFLENLGLEKGHRKVVNHEERGKVLRALDGNAYKVSAGGSLSNTLVALARLGQGELNVAMAGSVGSDPLGDFYRTKLLRANVHFLSKPIPDGTTGTVVVLTTPDAQRTMLAYQGMSSVVKFESTLEGAIAKSKMLVVEGYLWEIPETVEAIAKACGAAREKGSMVVLTASDVSCVLRFRKNFWDVMCESTDILFTNADEARALSGFSSSTSPALTARHLSRFCPLVSVTDGVKGSYLGMKGEVVYIPPAPCDPIDTCGAGDAYAAGVLHGLLMGVPDLRSMGSLAARVAAVVVGQQGTRLKEEHACELAASVRFPRASLWEGPVVRSMGLESTTTGTEKNASCDTWTGVGQES